MKKILHLLKDNKAFNALLNKQNIVVNSSNSEALLIASAFLTLKKDMLIVKSNQYEANLLYKQVSQMIDEVLYFPVDGRFRRIIRTKVRNDVSTYTTWSTSFDQSWS